MVKEYPKSKYRGVHWHHSCKKWLAKIEHNREHIRIGYFDNDIDAAKAYDRKAIELLGDKAKTNFHNITHYCEVENCGNIAQSKYKNNIWLCKRHISQIKQYGIIRERTSKDLNEIITYEDYSEIILYNSKIKEKARTIIDNDVVPLVENHKWYLRPDGYVASNNCNGEYTYLHSFIYGDYENYIDHIDINKLNNRRQNFRLATPNQNSMNQGIGKNNTSGKKGVHWSKDNNKWCAMIGYNKKHINLGYFDDYNDAVQCRIKAEQKYHKSYRPLDESVKYNIQH